ncbi:PIN domain-containing protein [Sandaracinobacteroides saxicola]|uniref:Ribonuclease VapC n=1 Tax=Sandaracinobacteroides saxicola TaxID=2759707 RepID=A0A7G5IGN3_9SPHN|nr:PIN domain-containing protein [Sandaracinobacteroides saxicola]QMW22525.1 PIN domain-containing protein [Sandaracinobacteroides saxicola]
MPYLLETSAAIHLRDNHAGIVSLLAELNQRPVLSVLSRAELEGGVFARPHLAAQRQRGLAALLRRLPEIDFTRAMAARYGRIVAAAGFSRRKAIDRMIAATALEAGCALITANPHDFSDIPDLDLIAWTP